MHELVAGYSTHPDDFCHEHARGPGTCPKVVLVAMRRVPGGQIGDFGGCCHGPNIFRSQGPWPAFVTSCVKAVQHIRTESTGTVWKMLEHGGTRVEGVTSQLPIRREGVTSQLPIR